MEPQNAGTITLNTGRMGPVTSIRFACIFRGGMNGAISKNCIFSGRLGIFVMPEENEIVSLK